MSPRGVLVRHHLAVVWRSPRTWGLLLAVALGLAAMTFFFSQTAEPDLLGKNAMLERLVLILLALGTGMVALHAADAVSGERERGTLEALMLSPLTGTDLVVAKATGALSWWVAVVAIGAPFAWVLASDTTDLRAALLVLLGAGTVLAVMTAGLGLAFSLRSSDNKRSIAATFAVLLALFGPGFVPRLGTLPYGELVLRADPAAAVAQILDITVVKGQPWASAADWFVSPVLAAVGLGTLVVAWSRRLALDPGVRH